MVKYPFYPYKPIKEVCSEIEQLLLDNPDIYSVKLEQGRHDYDDTPHNHRDIKLTLLDVHNKIKAVLQFSTEKSPKIAILLIENNISDFYRT